MSLPNRVERRSFGESDESLATRGVPIDDVAVDGPWRRWDPHRSKLGAMFELGMDTGLDGGESVLYLGAAAGTTVSHVAAFAGPTYAVEFAAKPMAALLDVAESWEHLFPLLKDARKPESYAHVVEPVDCLVQDVATRGQARVARLNRRFLRPEGRLLLSVKARSEDATREPAVVFDEVLADLEDTYEVLETESLEPYHRDHLAVVARPLTDE